MAVPQDIARLRRRSLAFHRKYGQPVMMKHRWTEDDVTAGLAQRCPYCRDIAYQQPRPNDGFCFGTGYLGGFKNGELIWMTIGDAREDTFKFNEAGDFVRDKHAPSTAPYTPKIEDGDLLIAVDLDENGNVAVMHERYLVDEVTPVSPRGFTRRTALDETLVNQNFQVDRLPDNHPFQQATLTFDVTQTLIDFPPPSPAPGDENVATFVTASEAVLLINVDGTNTTVKTTFPAEI